jgi:hypothetical protein
MGLTLKGINIKFELPFCMNNMIKILNLKILNSHDFVFELRYSLFNP